MLSLLLILLLIVQPEGTDAAEEYMDKSCGLERGRDIVYVVQDTPNMQFQDQNQMRISELQYAVDQSGSLDRFGLVGFSDKLTHTFPLSANKYQTKSAIKKLADTDKENANDASVGLQRAISDLSASQSVNEKIIVLLTMGTSINNEKIQELAQEAYQQDIQIHTISFGGTKTSPSDEYTLKKISGITGGNFNNAVNEKYLREVLANLKQEIVNFPGRELRSDWTLTSDVIEPRGLLVHENVKINLNGYNLTVTDDLVLLGCSEVRAVNGKVIKAKNLDQRSGSSIRLNNSQLTISGHAKQDGSIVVNGDFKGASEPELLVGQYTQRAHGYLNLAGKRAVSLTTIQEGMVEMNGGHFQVKGNLEQKGRLNIQEGTLQVDGNLTINGGPLTDEAYAKNKSLDVGGGLLQVGSVEPDKKIDASGNIRQLKGQLFVNRGTVKIFGDYTIVDGWLTMIKGSMDTDTPQYGEGDGDYVHVHGDFSTASKRNHGTRNYISLGKPMHDQGHLTDGVLKIEGTFTQVGNGEGHPIYSDRMENYEKDYSRYNFHSEGRHKVAMMNKKSIRVQGTGFTFNLLELHGKLNEFPMEGNVKWNKLNEVERSNNILLSSLTINDKSIAGFSPNIFSYGAVTPIEVPPNDLPVNGVQTVKVDARAQDRNATVLILEQTIASNGTGEVKVQVTAADGITKSVYKVKVKVGAGSNGKVTAIEFDRHEVTFTYDGSFKPSQVRIDYTVYPTNAVNQQVNWLSTSPDVAEVTPNGTVLPKSVGEATIIATTADGNLKDYATVKVLGQNDLLQGIKTLDDFTKDNVRYNKIMGGLYDLADIGVIVPGGYINELTFKTTGILTGGVIKTGVGVERVEVRVNGEVYNANPLGTDYQFSRANMKTSDYVEIIAYDNISNELERISTSYPVDFESGSTIAPGYYSIETLLQNNNLFNQILDEYSPKQLRFTAK